MQHVRFTAYGATLLLAVMLVTLLSGCLGPGGSGDRLGPPVNWADLEGWQLDKHSEAWPALLKNCQALRASQPQWKALCDKAEANPAPTDQQAKLFFESYFSARQVLARGDDNPDGLITGYYEPYLNGNDKPTERYRYPVYKRPDDLLVVELGELYPELKGKRVRARLSENNHVVPYFDRTQIEGKANPLRGNEIAWVDDPVALFFAQIQGSAKIRYADGRQLAIGYQDQNGHPYYAIGRSLIESGEIAVEDMSMQAIQQWLLNNPAQRGHLLNQNPSYVFFTVRENDTADEGPLGSLGVPLTAERSIAVDPKTIPLGSPVWLSTRLPEASPHNAENATQTDPVFQRLVFAQDTGGAIKGGVRADVFWGSGDKAEYYAGKMRESGRLYVLVPNLVQASRVATNASSAALP